VDTMVVTTADIGQGPTGIPGIRTTRAPMGTRLTQAMRTRTTRVRPIAITPAIAPTMRRQAITRHRRTRMDRRIRMAIRESHKRRMLLSVVTK